MVDTTSRKSGQRTGPMLALLAFAQFVVAVDYNIVFVALPDIGSALGFTAQSLQWVISAYAVAFGGFLLFGGRLVDRLGARRIFVLGLSLFGLACLVGGLADSPAVLITARAIQGFGAALLSPATLTLINTRFAEGSQRNRALALWGACGSGGLAAGALLGGVLTQAWGWEWVLLVLVPLALLAAVLAPATLAQDQRSTTPRGSFDAAGAVLATLGSSLLVLGLVSGPETGWGSLRGAGSIVTGAALLAVFVLVESKVRSPLVPLRLFRNRSLVTAILIILVFQSALGGAYYLFTNYLQGVLSYDAVEAGLTFVPLTVISMAASLRLAGALLAKWGPRATLFLGMFTNGTGMIVLAAAMSTSASFWGLVPGLIIWGVGGGVTFPAMFACAASGVAPQEAGAASALATASQQIGGAAGLALLVAVATAGLATGSGVAPAVADMAEGLRTAMWIGGAASVLGGLLAFTLSKPATVLQAKNVETPQERTSQSGALNGR
ncbi:MFS transporter [Streptomyces sp. VRA16 Mangrove soil]|uniref:MFS transporter n=1 Tax=Streptomyces sp. VRA16 Mangrove soil TaxID=2817434 RepID=UPI001A9D9B8A|nr:MFS transporter [Streptomyces sp. VRA16 Mangrove soil]MBO1330809.1 MFS transporter [Streptomyces sp. VRA16 Mangrove soil]